MLIVRKHTTLLLLLAIALAGCAEPNRRNTEDKLREVKREALKEASSSANQFGECVMVSTLLYRKSSDPPADIADAIQARCQDKLDAYEMWMATYYSATVERGSVESQSLRARFSKEELSQRLRQQAIQSIVDDRMKK